MKKTTIEDRFEEKFSADGLFKEAFDDWDKGMPLEEAKKKVILSFFKQELEKKDKEWAKRKKEAVLKTAEAGKQICDLRLKAILEELRGEENDKDIITEGRYLNKAFASGYKRTKEHYNKKIDAIIKREKL